VTFFFLYAKIFGNAVTIQILPSTIYLVVKFLLISCCVLHRTYLILVFIKYKSYYFFKEKLAQQLGGGGGSCTEKDSSNK